jgi:ABC-type branched-subunit amino acid transport system substrate-binding protein
MPDDRRRRRLPLRAAPPWPPASARVLAAPAVRPSFAQGAPIRVGVLHSLSGTMAISETALRDTVLMMVEWINGRGGLLGRRVEAVVVDPASNWPLFAEKARELLQVAKVDAVFGCWTSVSRKSVLPVFEELNGLLFYPVQYEGEEQSRNVFYTGAAPNQQAIPAVEYLMSADGGEAKAHRAARHGLRVPPHDEPHPARLPQQQGRRRRRHPGGVHARSATPTGRASCPA